MKVQRLRNVKAMYFRLQKRKSVTMESGAAGVIRSWLLLAVRMQFGVITSANRLCPAEVFVCA